VSLAVIVFYFYVLVVVLLVYISTIDLMPVRIQQQRALQEIINDISNKLLKQIKKEYVGRLKKFKCSSVDGKHPLVRFSTSKRRNLEHLQWWVPIFFKNWYLIGTPLEQN
jgi:hypothetical protein